MTKCEKRCFWTRKDAKEFVSKRKKFYGTMRIYRCVDDPGHEAMGMWHTTRQTAAQQQAWRDYKATPKNYRPPQETRRES